MSELTEGGFRLVLGDPASPAPDTVRRLIFCSREVRPRAAREARRDAARRSRSCASSSCIPWPEREITEQLARYPNAEVVWAQEEPGNMGARYFARRRIEELAGGRPVAVVARAASPSPATGSSTVHDAEQQKLLEEALTVS